MTKTNPLTTRVSVNLTEEEFDDLLKISAAQNKPYCRIVRESYQLAKHIHRRINDDPYNYTEDLRGSLKEALNLIFGNPKDMVK